MPRTCFPATMRSLLALRRRKSRGPGHPPANRAKRVLAFSRAQASGLRVVRGRTWGCRGGPDQAASDACTGNDERRSRELFTVQTEMRRLLLFLKRREYAVPADSVFRCLQTIGRGRQRRRGACRRSAETGKAAVKGRAASVRQQRPRPFPRQGCGGRALRQ